MEKNNDEQRRIQHRRPLVYGAIRSTTTITLPPPHKKINPRKIISSTQHSDQLHNQQPNQAKQTSMASTVGTAAADASTGGERRPNFGLNHRYGKPIPVQAQGPFPAVGSRLGPFFCLQPIGRGTFSSIHKCLHHEAAWNTTDVPPLAVAKLELSENFKGVLEAEAAILDFLDQALPPRTVPRYLGHYRCGSNYVALRMEYLPGQDMHQLRDVSRKIAVQDAVYLCADVVLPLLRKMHDVGMVHRDVKPSNVVRYSRKEFCIVDFGLSKSIVVAESSPLADTERPWTKPRWFQSGPDDQGASPCYRKERDKADFRGTSMYASPRVHQLQEYAPRDDIWSLLYVFCDLVSGGLPWMSHAANRDRDMCQTIKEQVHGLGGQPDQTEEFLKGDEYHVAVFRRNQKLQKLGPLAKDEPLPTPLAMSTDKGKVDMLRRAFAHLAKLQFWEEPDYDLIRACMLSFLDDPDTYPPSKPIDWSGFSSGLDSMSDLLDSDVFAETEKAMEKETDPRFRDDENRMTIEERFVWSQLEYNASRTMQVPPHVALQDWLRVANSLIYEEWDAKRLEPGGLRTSTDGFRRQCYIECLEKCIAFLKPFDSFRQRACCFHEEDENGSNPNKRRRLIVAGRDVSMLSLSKAILALPELLAAEKEKKRAPISLSQTSRLQ